MLPSVDGAGFSKVLLPLWLCTLCDGYVRVIQLVRLNLLPRGYVGAAYVLKIYNKAVYAFVI